MELYVIIFLKIINCIFFILFSFKNKKISKSVVEYDQNFRKFVSSAKWKSFSKRFPKIDYKFRTGSGVNGGGYIGNSGSSSSSSPSSIFVSQDDTKTLLDLYEKIETENSKDIEKLGGHLERALAYDAVWVMAYSLNYILKK